MSVKVKNTIKKQAKEKKKKELSPFEVTLEEIRSGGPCPDEWNYFLTDMGLQHPRDADKTISLIQILETRSQGMPPWDRVSWILENVERLDSLDHDFDRWLEDKDKLFRSFLAEQAASKTKKQKTR